MWVWRSIIYGTVGRQAERSAKQRCACGIHAEVDGKTGQRPNGPGRATQHPKNLGASSVQTEARANCNDRLGDVRVCRKRAWVSSMVWRCFVKRMLYFLSVPANGASQKQIMAVNDGLACLLGYILNWITQIREYHI